MPALLGSAATASSPPAREGPEGHGLRHHHWTFERSDVRQGASKRGFYYDFDRRAAIKKDSDIYKALDVLAKDVKIIGSSPTGRRRQLLRKLHGLK